MGNSQMIVVYQGVEHKVVGPLALVQELPKEGRLILDLDRELLWGEGVDRIKIDGSGSDPRDYFINDLFLFPDGIPVSPGEAVRVDPPFPLLD